MIFYNKDYSLQELLKEFNERINNCIDNVNESEKFINELKEYGIKEEVIKQLESVLNNSNFKIDGGIF